MSSINKRLKSLFEKYNIIFWYDDGGELKDELDNLSIDAKILQLDNNEFSIKYEILSAKNDTKFLIYSNHAKPNDNQNWLLDLEFRGHIFSADVASMIMQDIGIDIIYKPLIDRHIEFFRAKKRVEAFKRLFEKDDNEKLIALKMIASLLKCQPILEDILIKLITNQDKFKELQKYRLDEFLWQEVKQKYSYDASNETIKDFSFKLLQNHFYSCLDKSKCELNKDALLFVNNWMDSSSNKESFVKLSKDIEKELLIENTLQNYKIDDIAKCDTYDICERVAVLEIAKMIENKDIEKARDICKMREGSFWQSEYKNIYNAFLSAIELIKIINKSTFMFDSFDDGVEQYSKDLYKIDSFYRKYIYYSNSSEHIEILKVLNEKIEDIYLNDFLREINDKWQTKIRAYKESQFSYQRDFYTSNVLPIVAKKQKVFVVISDALRYECGVELKDIVLGFNRFDATIEPLIGVLPSYTQLGVASLLPNKSLKFEKNSDAVLVDGINSKGSKNRDKILKNTNEKSTYIDSENFLILKGSEGKKFVKNYEVIYIYHNEIDATGDKALSENRVFEAVESSFNTLERIIKQIANFNGTNIFVTADHGFLYQNRETYESEFCKIAKPINAKRFNRRFIIADKIEENSCIEIFNAKDLGIDGDEQIALAKSINKLRLQGGGNRFVHGGATLQEMVVPLIKIKKKRVDDVKDVEVNLLPISKITTNSVILSFYQEDAISQKVKPITLKIAFYSKDNNILSNIQTHTFDNVDEYERNREVKLKFDLKSDASNYSGKDIKIVMKKLIDGSSQEVVYKEYSIKLQLSFANDFDDF